MGLIARALYCATDAQEQIQAFVAKFGMLKDDFENRMVAQALVVVQTESKPANYGVSSDAK
jgi:hypothetical protein